MTGQQFGRLTVKGYCGKARWLCECACGKFKKVRRSHLVSEATTSCGCYRVDRAIAQNTKHGHVKNNRASRTYCTWASMKTRCNNPNADNYSYYGGRGIKVHGEWDTSFLKFYAYMGERPLNHTIDRIDPNGNYEPGNVRWATPTEQGRNKRR